MRTGLTRPDRYGFRVADTVRGSVHLSLDGPDIDGYVLLDPADADELAEALKRAAERARKHTGEVGR